MFVLEAVHFFVILNVDDLFNLLRSSTTEFDEFFGEGLVVLFKNNNSMSEDIELLGIARLDLDNLFNVDGILSGGLRNENRSILTLDCRNIDNIAAVLGVTDGRFTAVDKGV